jgi:hypothetical protein
LWRGRHFWGGVEGIYRGRGIGTVIWAAYLGIDGVWELGFEHVISRDIHERKTLFSRTVNACALSHSFPSTLRLALLAPQHGNSDTNLAHLMNSLFPQGIDPSNAFP